MKENPNQDPIRPVCGAKNRRGEACGNWPMANGRCRYHGGLSTGPKTPEGIAKIKAATTKHGAYTADARLFRAMVRLLKAES